MIAFVPFSQSGHKTHTHTQMYKNQKLILLVKLLSSTKPQTGLVQQTEPSTSPANTVHRTALVLGTVGCAPAAAELCPTDTP